MHYYVVCTVNVCTVNLCTVYDRARLEVQTNPTNEMLQLLNDNINWLNAINEEISSKFQLIGDTVLLRAQYEQSEVRTLTFS